MSINLHDLVCRPRLDLLPSEVRAGLAEGRYRLDLSGDTFRGVIRDGNRIVKWVQFEIVEPDEGSEFLAMFREVTQSELAIKIMDALCEQLTTPALPSPGDQLDSATQLAVVDRDERVVVPVYFRSRQVA